MAIFTFYVHIFPLYVSVSEFPPLLRTLGILDEGPLKCHFHLIGSIETLSPKMVTFLDNEKQVLKYMNFGRDTNKAATEAMCQS